MPNSWCFLAESWYNDYHQIKKGGRSTGVAATLVNWHTIRQCCYQMSWGLLAPDVHPSLLGRTGTMAYQLRLLSNSNLEKVSHHSFPDHVGAYFSKLEPKVVQRFKRAMNKKTLISPKLQGQLTGVASIFFENQLQHVQPWLLKAKFHQRFKCAWIRDVYYGSSSATLKLTGLERLMRDRCFLRFLDYDSLGNLTKYYALARSFMMIEGEDQRSGLHVASVVRIPFARGPQP